MSISPRAYRRKYGLPPPGDDLLFPGNKREATVEELKAGEPLYVKFKTTAEYVAAFNKLNHLKE